MYKRQRLFFLVLLRYIMVVMRTAFETAAFIADRIDITERLQSGAYLLQAGILLFVCLNWFPHVWYVGLASMSAALFLLLANVAVSRKLLPDLRFGRDKWSPLSLIHISLSGISYVQGNYTNYRINCSIAVTSQSETGNFTGNSSYFNPNDFYLAQDMVDAVGYVMKSERVLREAAESVRIVDPDPVAIARNLDIERYNETQIIEISLKWHLSLIHI